MAQKYEPVLHELSLEEMGSYLTQLRDSDLEKYNEYLRWFRVKRTLIEIVLDRGYGGANNRPPPTDALDLEDDTDLIYHDAQRKIKIGYDAVREREALVKFIFKYSQLAHSLEQQVANLPKTEQRKTTEETHHKLLSWEKISYVDALSNVYYSRKWECYLYVRLTDMNYKKDDQLNYLITEQRSALPIRYPGYKLNAGRRYIPELCHVIYVFMDSERESKPAKRAFELLAEDAKSRAQAFFVSDLVFNITHHYLSPQFAFIQKGSRCACMRGKPSKEPAPTQAETGNAEAEVAEAETTEAETTEAEAEATEAQINSDLAAWKTKKSDLPILLMSDPVVKQYGVPLDSIAMITNFPLYNGFMQATKTFRRVHS